MWPFPRRQHQPSPESECAMEAAAQSLREARAGLAQAEARLTESRRVKEQLKAHNRANAYSDFIEGIVLGRLSDG